MIADAEFLDRLRAVRATIDPAVLAELREIHDAYDFGCAAHSEGLGCCLDWLVADGPELHQVSRRTRRPGSAYAAARGRTVTGRAREPDLLVLRCNAVPDRCRWRPPEDLEMPLVQAHFDLEDGHDPTDIRLELVAWCHRCDVEMELFRVQDLGQGTERHWYLCTVCRHTRKITKGAAAA